MFLRQINLQQTYDTTNKRKKGFFNGQTDNLYDRIVYSVFNFRRVMKVIVHLNYLLNTSKYLDSGKFLKTLFHIFKNKKIPVDVFFTVPTLKRIFNFLTVANSGGKTVRDNDLEP